MAIELITAWCMLAALVAYALLGGADFGAGVWDLLAAGPRKQAQRNALAHAIGPIWEANHVWLILVVVILFTCFPPAFAAIMTALHVPVTLVLLGIVARGTAFVFRTYTPSGPTQARWGRVFSIASVITPVLLGVVLGTIASGRLKWEGGIYISGFFEPWLTPFPWLVGAFVLATFAFLAAVFITAETRAPPLETDFRRRAIGAWCAVAILGGVTWASAAAGAPRIAAAFAGHWWARPLQAAAITCSLACLGALAFRRVILARTLAVAQVTLVVVGYGAALFPYLVVPGITMHSAAAPPATHRLVLGALAAGLVILVPALVYLFRVFKGRRAFDLLDTEAGPHP